MRLQQILHFFSRSSPKPIKPTAAAIAGVEMDMVPAREGERGRRSPDRLALQAAIIHHLEWCVLFNEHLSAEETDSASPVPLPSAADSGLGQWLVCARESPAGASAHLEDLTEEHQRFHEFALQALALASQGRMDLASTLLNTDFERSRARVLELLRHMQKG